MLLNMLMYKLNKTPLVGMGYGWAFACMSFAVSLEIVVTAQSRAKHILRARTSY